MQSNRRFYLKVTWLERLKKSVGNLNNDRGVISGTSTAMFLSISWDYLTPVVIRIFIHVWMRHCAVLQVETSISEEYAATVFHG